MLIMKRKMAIFLFVILTPLAVGMMLNCMVGIGNLVHTSGRSQTAVIDIGTVPPCGEGPDFDPEKDDPCVSVGYAMIGAHSNIEAPEYQRYHDIMGLFAK